MKIAILGAGKEGQSAANYFKTQKPAAEITFFQDFTAETLQDAHLSDYDLIVRSPSVPLRWLEAARITTWTSVTRLFFQNCPCPIIGVTGTKGKGTTSSLIAEILRQIGRDVQLVGNIGTPALDILPQLTQNSFVVYEMSSFQLWDLPTSPHVCVILPIEPDHLNVHSDYNDYLDAKGHIARFQSQNDACIFYAPNPDSAKLANLSPAQKYPYPLRQNHDALAKELATLLSTLAIPGRHNQDNAEAAVLACAAALNLQPLEFIAKYHDEIQTAFRTFRGLPHRLEYLRDYQGIKIYDDNFSTTPTSTKVALEAFPDSPIVAIIGGRDKTAGKDLPELASLILSTKNLQKVVLIGESGHDLAKLLPVEKYILAETLEDAITHGINEASLLGNSKTAPIFLMSPAAASFDMFQNVYDRGAKFQKLIQELK